MRLICVGAIHAVHRRDTVLVFRKECGPSRPPRDDIVISYGSLMDLAAMASEYPEWFAARQLHSASSRLKEGDRVHLATRDGHLMHVVWAGIRKSIQISEVGNRCRVQLEEPGLLIYDCWAPEPARGQGAYQRVLAELSANHCQECGSAWVYCREENISARRDIENTGFELRYRLRRHRWFSAIEQSRVRQV